MKLMSEVIAFIKGSMVNNIPESLEVNKKIASRQWVEKPTYFWLVNFQVYLNKRKKTQTLFLMRSW